MKYRKSIEAMFKAGRMQATAYGPEQKLIANRYLDLAVKTCEEERPPFHIPQAAYQDGLKADRTAKIPSYDGIA